MLFNSFSFLIFFPLVAIGYWILPARFRVLWLLVASCYFYMAFVPAFVLILFGLITVDFFLGQAIEKQQGHKRLVYLVLSVCANIGVLFFFKYFNFFTHNVAALAQFLHFQYAPTLLSIALPLGLSFHVFQSLSYVIEVYRGRYRAEKNYLTYALYVMFFPQLVAGPIERPQHLLPQLHLTHTFDATRARRGLERMLWGFFKKLVIADQIAQVINPLFANPSSEGPVLIFMAAAFTYQLYCDFSGYADIAVGSAMVLGFELTENFNRPFAAVSVADFWRRWHISLSNWLKDYLYYPLALGWGKVSKVRLYASLFITFVLIGLWHGANWTFVVMGTMHGTYLVVGSITEKWRNRFADAIGFSKFPRLRRAWQIAIVFMLVTLSFIFFRAPSVTQAWFMVTHLLHGLSNLLSYHYVRYELFTGLGVWNNGLGLVVFLCVVVMELVQYYQARAGTFYIFDSESKWARFSWYYLLVLAVVCFGYFGAEGFIYFKF
ncbi:MAG: alginate O-acetyltransferase complex protein AlgI [Patescibacteria group bacterium]|nr:alginate O-acetyltransferase complex protein AlgI [Patescibacteria group bacterium]